MNKTARKELTTFMAGLIERNPGEVEFHQAVQEVCESVIPYLMSQGQYRGQALLERLSEPDRVVIFRVCWEADDGSVQTNRAWRVQFNNALGAYKGGLRFHPSVNQSVLKFLGFEQTFKNALTTLPMGGAKGGSNFDPKGKSDREVMRFCQALMSQLSRHIGPQCDVPAGDIGVGGREIGYLFGQYKRLQNEFSGVLTGKGLAFGGSLGRTEATGYGVVYFVGNMLERLGESFAGKSAIISGSGNVAVYCAEKLVQLGARPVTLSDSAGFIHDPDGFDEEKLAYLKTLKFEERGRINEYANRYKRAQFHKGLRPWSVPADMAFPCATQNELDCDDAQDLVKNGVGVIAEGANMPCTLEAQHLFRSQGVAYAPAKASNAGGVAVSGLEQSQNAMRLNWSADEVDTRLQNLMANIHHQCVTYGAKPRNSIDYVDGANLAGFVKVADAMCAQGVI